MSESIGPKTEELADVERYKAWTALNLPLRCPERLLLFRTKLCQHMYLGRTLRIDYHKSPICESSLTFASPFVNSESDEGRGHRESQSCTVPAGSLQEASGRIECIADGQLSHT